MTYLEYVSQFEILEKQVGREGYHYHHIIPRCAQKQFGLKDDHGVLITPAQHLWAHILYDKENGTNTATGMLNQAHLQRDTTVAYEDCLSFNEVDAKYRTEQSERMKGGHHTEEHRQRISNSNKGKNTWIAGRKFYTNGIVEVCRFECPEGFWLGRLPVSQETRDKQSKAKKGKPSKNKGKPSWNKGGKAPWVKGTTKGTRCWNNGERNKYSKECPGEGWILGMLRGQKLA